MTHLIMTFIWKSLKDLICQIPIVQDFKKTIPSNWRGLYLGSLYGIKQLGSMWYNNLIEYLLKDWYKNDFICPCIFMKIQDNEFSIITIYVDDINIIGISKELLKGI